MKRSGTQLNKNTFYKKSRGLFEIALWMQNSEKGVSILEIMQKAKVSRRTAIRIKDSLKEWFPQIQETKSQYNIKRWSIPKGTIDYNQYTSQKDIFQTKLEELISLANKYGYSKVTPKQLMIAYYGKYTTQDASDRKTLAEIEEGIKKLPLNFSSQIDSNE